MRPAAVRIGDRLVGDGEPTYVVAEIGINHNGSVEMAKRLIDGAVQAGCDAVKFQKRTPELCVPREQWAIERDTPWGRLTYIEYRRRMEFGHDEFAELDRHAKRRGIPWFASCWDIESVRFIERFDPPCHKVASACVTDLALLRAIAATGRPTMLSTGMSTFDEIERAVLSLGRQNLLIAHSTSTYPCPPVELNLRMIHTLKHRWPDCPVGYSGHEPGLVPTWVAVGLGATFVERHITLDRTLWGSDQAASVEVTGFRRLVEHIRDIELALGDGIKRVQPGEVPVRNKLRLVRPEREEKPLRASERRA
ncbi:MAG TPA: N-acetylneuraminate synthase family protein [Polyangiaceae bacterium]|nr:N-acetylneuraminate synthase family protein [Polyangiaceae bacterium]